MSSEYPPPDQQPGSQPPGGPASRPGDDAVPVGGHYGQSYGQPPPGYPPYGPARTSPMAVTALVLGVVGLFCSTVYLVSIGAVVTGLVARKQVATSRGTLAGGGMAVAGLVLGIVGIVLATVYWILVATGVLDIDSLLRSTRRG